MGERVDAGDLVVGGTVLVVDYIAVKLRGFFADAFLAGDGAAFLGGHDLPADLVGPGGKLVETFTQSIACIQFAGTVDQSIADTFNALHVKAHGAEQVIDAHGGIKLQFAVFGRVLGAGIGRNRK